MRPWTRRQGGTTCSFRGMVGDSGKLFELDLKGNYTWEGVPAPADQPKGRPWTLGPAKRVLLRVVLGIWTNFYWGNFFMCWNWLGKMKSSRDLGFDQNYT